MLGLVLIYWIGKTYYALAGKHGKNEWGYAILGVVVYYGGQIALGLFALMMTGLEGFDSEGGADIILNLAGAAVGGLICWMFYEYLKKKWNKPPPPKQGYDDVLDSDFLDEVA